MMQQIPGSNGTDNIECKLNSNITDVKYPEEWYMVYIR